MGKRLWDLAKSRFEIGTFLLAHRHKVALRVCVRAGTYARFSRGVRGEGYERRWQGGRLILDGR